MASPSRSGIFQQPADPLAERFSQSIDVDRRLYPFDIRASQAHARMLQRVGLLTAAEFEAITSELDHIREEFDRDAFPTDPTLEDIHMHVEQALIDRLGDVGRKLHTGRSRNDQVATDLRLWCRDTTDHLIEDLRNLQRAFVHRCDVDGDVVLPAYTHLQRAQPVLAAHCWLAYCEKFERDIERLQDCRRRTNRCVLGSAAVAGTSLPIDRDFVARELGFDSVSPNSIDGTSDRDFVIELLFCLSMIAVHLSGWAEEWILWSSAEFQFLKLPEAYCTGSSIMPQKRNPDMLELIRGRAARAIAAVQALLVLSKGLPQAYNRDLQEDKWHLFQASDSVRDCLQIAAPIVHASILDQEHLQRQIESGFLDATSLMEYLILRGVPQRSAHHLVGELVQMALSSGRSLAQIPLAELQMKCPAIQPDVYDVLGARNAVYAFRSFGSTAPDQVTAQLQSWKQKLCL